ncbi:alpha/beta hydrolase [Pseudolysobacter antarcticus]|uniref:Alpha/beta hydrolase n=1 Tax=Pseudolysobacter antarcticus TaxID=2511995 RepID=A0A411HG09_9GAMM|nr:alpha/beta hydrolase [Pseudolysobacter antarcticus]QBB69428.1 alpha/beta hydrolase [Pseudolysobacter antarcticus]
MHTIARVVLSCVVLSFAFAAHAERNFSGTTASGAYYQIAVPDGWKAGDSLILFQHGLSFDPPAPNPDLGPLKDLQLSEGYAIAASSFRQRSWALFSAPDDNADLLAAFKQQVGTPGAIIPYGGSLGGLIALKLAEDPRFAPVPGVYSACPPAAGSRVWDTAIDLRLAYDVVCHDAGDLPTGKQPYPWAYNLNDIPDNLSDLEDQALLIPTLIPLNRCTGVNLPQELRNGAMKRRLAQLMDLAHISSEKFFVTNAGYAIYALSDLVRAPDKLNTSNPFTTVGVDYNDATLNADILRIQADPLASLYFRWASDFRGNIGSAKVISVQTSQDQLVIPANQYTLRQTLPSTQLTSAIVNETTPTHCGFSLAEGVSGWEALRSWIAGGAQPSVNDLQTGCNNASAAGASGACRYDATIVPPSFDSQVRPRPASTAPNVDARYSGQWYDSSHSVAGAIGVMVEVLDDGSANMTMFTYPRAGVVGARDTPSGAHTWLTGVGEVIGNGIEFPDVLLQVPDGRGAMRTQHWGRLGMSFDSCEQGSMRWDWLSPASSQTVPIQRRTHLDGMDCSDTATATNATQQPAPASSFLP